ncbi:MAG TPA: clan AA aspartic protease [Phycisphaerae bacterium]|nr:clan AA aspartic protease [Phycisphaerae bacterium]
MIRGVISQDREIVVSILVHGPREGSVSLPAAIDTGFNGYLTLPPNAINALELPYHSQATATLGDGSVVSLRRFEGSVDWHGQRREAMILEAEGGPLIGVSLLYGSRLIIDFADDGQVVIEPLDTIPP